MNAGKDSLQIVRERTRTRERADEAWRTAIIEAFLDGATTREIAERAGLSHEGVRLIIRKAGF
jgi:DNA-binding NarL/FixJ family response regulator